MHRAADEVERSTGDAGRTVADEQGIVGRPGTGGDGRRTGAVGAEVAAVDGDVASGHVQRCGRAIRADAEIGRGVIDGTANGDGERAVVDRRATGVAAAAGKRKGASAEFQEASGAAHRSGVAARIRVIEGEDAVVDDIRVDCPGRAAASDAERARLDRRQAGERVCAGEREHAVAELRERAGAADCPGKGRVIGAVEDDDAGVGDVAHERAGCPTVADTECAGGHRRASVVGVGPGERERAASELLEGAACAGEARGEGYGLPGSIDGESLVACGVEAVGIVGRVGPAVPHHAAAEGERAGGAEGVGTAEDGRAAVEVRAAGIAARAGQGERADPRLRQIAAAGDVPGVGLCADRVESEARVVVHISGDRPIDGAVTDLQRARRDRRQPRERVLAGERERSPTEFRDRPGAGKDADVARVVGAVEDERAVVGQIGEQFAARASKADAERSPGGEIDAPAAPLEKATADRHDARA